VDNLFEPRRNWLKSSCAVLASAVCFAPQLVFWQIKAHSPLAMPLVEHGVRWGRLSVAEVLFSTNRGLFTWSPVAYLAVLGLLVWAGQNARLAFLFLAGFLLQVYVNASVAFWWSGWSFGSRRFDNCLLFFVVGFAALLEFLRRRPMALASCLCAGLVLWNFGLMGQSREGRVAPDRLVSFEDVAVRNVKSFYSVVGFPFAFPASWYFAWRNGVSPERFDRLFGHQGFANLRQDFDPESEAFAGRGWGEAERDAGGRWFRWCVGGDCTLLVPLRAAADYSLTVRLRPADGTSPNALALAVNGASQAEQAVVDESALRFVLPAPLWHPGTNELRLGFARTARPSDVGRTTDRRPLAARVFGFDLLVQGGAVPERSPGEPGSDDSPER